MENKKIVIEAVIKEPPYISIGYVMHVSNNKVVLTHEKEKALFIESKEMLNKAIKAIHNNLSFCMAWITDMNGKRLML